uniref:Uncharacterized protein n=1 Tax=Ixodes ricinus TaxID=34613 RepID=A0A6B0U217_IXORI
MSLIYCSASFFLSFLLVVYNVFSIFCFLPTPIVIFFFAILLILYFVFCCFSFSVKIHPFMAPSFPLHI